MKYYDFQKAKNIIESEREEIVSASLGMEEDWCWTSATVFENGKFVIDLEKCKEICGIDGSYWATPILEVEYKNGFYKEQECFKYDANDSVVIIGSDENSTKSFGGYKVSNRMKALEGENK